MDPNSRRLENIARMSAQLEALQRIASAIESEKPALSVQQWTDLGVARQAIEQHVTKLSGDIKRNNA